MNPALLALNPDISIRDFEKGDLLEVVPLYVELLRSEGTASDSPEGELQECIAELAKGASFVVACVAGKVVGAMAYGNAELSALAVAPSWQGSGIGSALVNYAKAKMPGGFSLNTAVGNVRAQRLYEGLGLTRLRYVYQWDGNARPHDRWAYQVSSKI